MSRKPLIISLYTVVLLVLASACGQLVNESRDTTKENCIAITAGGESETQTSLDACLGAFDPGTKSTVHLTVENNADRALEGNLCVQLLAPAPSDVVVPLANESISLQADSRDELEVEVQLPADLAPGTWGLALVVNTPAGPSTGVMAVHVGQGQAETAGTGWSMEAALAACPSP